MNVMDRIYSRIRQLECCGFKVTGIVLSSDVVDELKILLPLLEVEGLRIADRPVAVCNSSFVIALEFE